MRTIPRPLQICLIILLLLAMLLIFTLLVRNIMQDNTVGMDYSIYWTAGKETFLEHRSPYSDELALQNQLRVLRRASRPDEDQMAYAYPPYALLLALPTFWLNFDYAQAGWTAFNILLLVSAVFLTFPKSAGRGILCVLFLYPFTFGLLLGNFVIPIGSFLLLALGFLLLLPEKPLSPFLQVTLGILLAWITVKPQFVWLYLLFILLFAWRERYWTLLISFAASASAFLALSFLIVPGWPTLWLERMQKYSAYVQSFPMTTLLLKSFLPLPVAYVLSGMIFVVLLTLSANLIRRWWLRSLPLIDLLLWLGLVTYLFHPRNVSYSQIAFLIPFVLWVLQSQSWKKPGVWLSMAGAIALSWLVLVWTLSQPDNLLLDEIRLAGFALWMIGYFSKNLRHTQPNLVTRIGKTP